VPDGVFMIESDFKKQVRTAARRVVSCLYAAQEHLDVLIEFYKELRTIRADRIDVESRMRCPARLFPPVDRTSDIFDQPFRDSWAESAYEFDYYECPFAVQMGDGINILARIALYQQPFPEFEIDFWFYFRPT
jgi:hypothetical protein